MIVFSGYWEVANNPKHTVKIGHINRAKLKPINVFFCEKHYEELPFRQIILPYNELPAHQYIKGLKSKNNTVLKYGTHIQNDAFIKLVTIWVSKILLFKEVAKLYPDENEFVWADCVRALNLKDVMNSKTGLSTFLSKMKVLDKPFAGILKDIKIDTAACTIKMYRHTMDEFIDTFIDVLIEEDTRLQTYDEETILSIMRSKHPHLFSTVKQTHPA